MHTDPDLEQWIQAISVDEVEQPADPNLMSLMRAEKLVLENFNPIRTLADRLSKPNIMLAQGKTEEHAQLLDKAKIKLNGKSYIQKDGLIVNSENENILIPPQLEGVTLSHAHMGCGHIGWGKLYTYVLSRYNFYS